MAEAERVVSGLPELAASDASVDAALSGRAALAVLRWPVVVLIDRVVFFLALDLFGCFYFLC